MSVDSNYAGDKASCRSRSGVYICVNIAFVQHSKKQYTVETPVFVAEFVTMKQGIDAL